MTALLALCGLILLWSLPSSADVTGCTSGSSYNAVQHYADEIPFAQKFNASMTIGRVDIYADKYNTAQDLVLQLRPDSGGVPSDTISGSCSVPNASLGSWGLYGCVLDTPVAVDGDYWVVVGLTHADASGSYYLKWAGTGSAGGWYYRVNEGAWTLTGTASGCHQFQAAATPTPTPTPTSVPTPTPTSVYNFSTVTSSLASLHEDAMYFFDYLLFITTLAAIALGASGGYWLARKL